MKEISSAEFETEVLSEGLVALDFYSTECPPCEALAPKFESLNNLYGKDIKFIKIFRQENRELASKLGVSSSPTVLFFKDGQQVGTTLSGGIKRKDLMNNLDSMLPIDRIAEIKAQIKPVVTECDVVVLGAGPGGLAASIYLAQAKLNTILVDTQLPGGQVSLTHQVSNYPGFVTPVNGYMLSHYMSEQAKHAGVTFKAAVDVTKVNLEKKEIIIDEHETIRAKKIVISTGASPRPLGIPGEKEFKGRGISYCATCDAKYFQDKEVIVIGGGNTAVEESEFIAKFASKITLVHQFDKLTANKEAQEKLFANPKASVLFECEPRAFEKSGDKMTVTYENLKTKELHKIESDGIFVFVGMQPNISLFANQGITLDKWGYIAANEDMETNIDGVYAVGDVISKKYRQITTAVSDGTIAAIAISKKFN
ncbi:MAG TPA: FAD-dependent oxidoreductase [Bacteroidales bacterium]|nr:FAD-dependent oxidoreductase [Bacteroidales bacterium]